MHASKKLLSAAIVVALAGSAGAALAAPPAGSPYFADPQQSRVEDATSRGIQQVNMITCLMHAMRPDALVNDGAYIALVDEAKCSPQGGGSSAGSGASSDASQAASYMTAVVNSTRASNSDPMRARIWIEQNEQDVQATIFVNTSATEAPSTATPYGVFRLDFCGRADVQPGCMMRGYLDGSSSGLSYYEQEDNEQEQKTVALRLSSVGTGSGSGRLQLDQGSDQLAFLFAYDQDHFRRNDGNGDQCFSRDASDPATGLSVWRYGLYDAATGERVSRNSGFPIEYSSGGHTYHGYLSYWGLSLPPEAAQTLSSGATVQKVDYSGGNSPTRTDYTLVKTGGKLLKHTKQARTLAETDKIRFNTWVGDVTGFYAGAVPNTQYILYWDNTAGTFKVTGRMDCSSGRCETQDLQSEEAVPYTFWSSSQGGVRGWSEALGGELFIDLRSISGTLVAADVDVIYRKQEIVYPDQMPTTLHCLRDCPTAATLDAYFAEGSSTDSPFATGTFNHFGPASDVVTYGTDSGVLEDNVGDAVTMTDAEALQRRPQFQWGVRTGRLFTQLSAAECPNLPGSYCESQIDALDTYYSWETGSGQWNQFAAVKDTSGNFVVFDAPLQLQYQVPAGAQYGDYAGKSIVLQYGGFGDLWGIPGYCVSRLTNATVSCETQDSRYVPAFVIPFDAAVGRVTQGETTYLVKWLEREIRFARKAPSACASLALPSDVTLPTAAGLQDPSDPASSIYIGTKPVVTDAPRVIQGEVKY
jgi:hypothetical protein